MPAAARTFELVPVDRLTVHPDNPRRGNVNAIKQSIEANGFQGALVVQRSTGLVLAGNHRLVAARELGHTKVPVIWADVDDERARRILLADNRTADQATWDEAALAELLGELAIGDEALIGTGFSEDDLSDLLARQARAAQPRQAMTDGDRVADSTPEQLERYEQAGSRFIMLEYPSELFAKVVAALDSYRAEHSLDDNSAAVRHLLGVAEEP
jgi:ParB-like chromosome segregation protein Spo0J